MTLPKDTPLTLERLKELRQLHDAATNGEWSVRPDEFDDWGMIRAGDGMPVAVANCEARVSPWRNQIKHEWEASDYPERWHAGPPEVAANASLIAAMRNALPALLDLAERQLRQTTPLIHGTAQVDCGNFRIVHTWSKGNEHCDCGAMLLEDCGDD